MGKDVLRIARANNPKMSRRKFIQLGTGAVVVAAVAAGGYYFFTQTPQGGQVTSATSASSATSATSTSSSWVKPASIRFDGWGGSMQDSERKIAFNGFEQEYGIKIVDGAYGQTSEIMSKIKAANGGEWDLVEVDNDTIYFGTMENLWQPLRLENIPNHDKLPDIFKTNGHGAFDPGFKDGVFHGIPGPMYGTTPVVINTTKVTPDPTSWDCLWDQKWKGRMCLEDYWITRMRDAAVHLGQDYNNITDVDAIWKALSDQQKLVFKYWESGAEMETELTNGEAWIGDLWGGRVQKLAQRGVPVKTLLLPQTEVWTDAFVVPINAPHRYEAELLLNYMLDPKVNVALALEFLYPPIIDSQYIPADSLEQIKLMPDFVGNNYDKLGFANTGYYNDHKQAWTEKWTSIMSGA
ncbi:MAG: extracellular solute-binding protein [Candidatus Bathyarchaeia archaeon]